MFGHYVCATQFKSSRPFYALCRYHRNENIKHIWNFFESGHGKGEHDGVGACIKCALRKYQMNYQGVCVNDAHHVVEWCKTHFALNKVGTSSTTSQQVPYRVFWEMTRKDVYIYLNFMQLSYKILLLSFIFQFVEV